MSAITFQDRHASARLSGAERHWLGSLCRSWFIAALNLDRPMKTSPILRLVPPGHYLHSYVGPNEGMQALKTFLRVGDVLVLPGGTEVCIFDAQLNTAIALGGDVPALAARVHGQCEIHGWVDGPDRTWLADIIHRGRRDNILRPGQGWEQVAMLLRSRDDESVVTSYSVTDSFPNPHVASLADDDEADNDEAWDAWGNLSADEQWDFAMAGLGTRMSRHLQWRPVDWHEQGMGTGLSGYDLRRIADDLDRAEPTATPEHR
jgi:hypothetical protein